MKLNPHEINTSVWAKLREHYAVVIAKKRERIENPRISPDEHIQLAWEINTIKGFLAHGDSEREQADAD